MQRPEQSTTIYGLSTAKVLVNVRFRPSSEMQHGVLMSVITGDGLRHFGYQKEQRFYNGVTLDQIHSESTVNGIHGQ